MHWTDSAIVLSARKHGENSAIVRVFARNHGVYGGVVRGIHSKANRGIIQPGNVVNATWQARLSEQLGSFKCELLEAHAAHIMQEADRLAALSSLCALLEVALPERHPYPKLYEEVEEFLAILGNLTTPAPNLPPSGGGLGRGWLEPYVHLELQLLAEAGFGLDLSQCAATGTTEDLIYVSPKSGRVVCREAGEPYKDKLLPLPGFLRHPRLVRGSRAPHADGECLPRSPHEAGMTSKETLAGLRLTGYFLQHWLLEPHNRKLPAARGRLVQMIKEFDTVKEPHGTEA